MAPLKNQRQWAQLVRGLPPHYGVRDQELQQLLIDGDEGGVVSLFQRRFGEAQQELRDFRQSHERLERLWQRHGAWEERIWRRIQKALEDGDDKLADRLEEELSLRERAPLAESDDVELEWYREQLRSYGGQHPSVATNWP